MVGDRRLAPAAPDEDVVHGACAPGGVSAADRDAHVGPWVAAMRERGIERVLVLLSDRQVRWYDDLLGDYREAFGSDRVAHVPVQDHHLADSATLREALDVLDAADDAGEPVVVHCLAGVGRTGQVLAAWLVHARGYDPEAAVETVGNHGRDAAEAVRSGNARERELYDLLETVA